MSPYYDPTLKTLVEASSAPSQSGLSQRRNELPMAFDEILAQRVRRRLARRKNIDEKTMFGGVGFLLNGNLLVAVRKDSLLVRIGPEQNDEALLEPHVSEFKIKGRGTMKGWVVVGLEGVQSDDQLNDWIQRAMKFVTTLPAKED